MQRDESVLIVGASARAAAQSARRGGWRVAAVDRFADRDLRACSAIHGSDGSIASLLAAAAALPAGPWMYTGGVENQPELIEALSAVRPLWGNSADVCRRVRDPWQLADAVRSAGEQFPDTARFPPRDAAPGWLLKSRRSAGGLGVRRWNAVAMFPAEGDAYVQREVAGQPVAAVYLAGEDQCVLLGVSEQLLGTGHDSGGAFCYAGSMGPWPHTAFDHDRWRRLGERLACWAGLRGLFGVDAVLDPRQQIWVVELNPRYTASVEILEQNDMPSAVARHAAVFRGEPVGGSPAPPTRWRGKQVVYAHGPVLLGDAFEVLAADGSTWLADVPQPRSEFKPGAPLCTVLAEGQCRRDVVHQLAERAQQVRQTLIEH